MSDRSGNGKGKGMGKGPNCSSVPVPFPRRPSSGDSGAPRHKTSRTHVTREIGSGVAGSNRRGAINQQTNRDDPLADMVGVIYSTLNPHGVSIFGGQGKEHADYYYDQDFDVDIMRRSSPRVPNTLHTPHSMALPWVLHMSLHCHLSPETATHHPWPVFSKIPLQLRTQMFERFRTLYRWYPTEEERIYQGFENILKKRDRDRMRDVRDVSFVLAEQGGH
ncbi:unnamed protein product [Lactuca virosa]|uniref:Uncharacterized protein n=1 Tax=Lactuca virosa TaxID=75947 RepID=A0AAU9MPI3_9ASTR|nr:unnamed protein product [Lactuca virosa]